MNNFIYTGEKTKEISFPLGGIGTGCLGLGGDGRLIDWEIFNKPNKGSLNGFSHFAIKAETEEEVIDARVLNGPLQAPFTGAMGPDRGTMAGVHCFSEVEFKGEYPLAQLNFKEKKFPGNVVMKAFNPFIPLNDKDSSIPGAFFEIELENTSNETLTYTIAFSLNNPLPQGTTVNKYRQEDDIHLINFTSSINYIGDEADFGDLTIATNADDVSFQEYWYRGRWFDNLGIYWQDFKSPGKLKNRSYPVVEEVEHNNKPLGSGKDIATLAGHIKLKSGEKKSVRFTLNWNFPNFYNYWNPEKTECESGNCECKEEKTNNWKNYYATIFSDSTKSAIYSLKNWDSLYQETILFKDALFTSTLPTVVLDAISANMSILKSPTCLRLEDGSFYGFEGCHDNSGCCEGSCTHVWNYQYALPFLFPKLERSMRDLDFKYNQREDGKMSFRLQLPIGRDKTGFRACADGQFGAVIKAYRDWKISGDTEWLKSNWAGIKKAIEFAYSQTNEDKWDLDKDGVLEGRQHHTLDMELFGPNSWLTGFYLAALKAGAEMAEHLGESKKVEEYMSLFEKGKSWVDENLFNGEYYQQLIDLKDKSILESFNANEYWNDEAKEIKYQIDQGSCIDQVLAQWHANIIGLGEIFNPKQTKKALESIYKYNFKKSMKEFFNPCRLYSLNEEAGVVICDWPEGKKKPVVPLTYAEETMNGYEYQAAIHMIQEGMVEEGLEIVEAIRERYDGKKRNPWNEFECGHNYARSMASYALLLTFSGFDYNLVEGLIGFNPIKQGDFKCFWSLDTGWGMFELKGKEIRLEVLFGELKIKNIKLPFITKNVVQSVTKKEEVINYKQEKEMIILSEYVIIEKDSFLSIKIK